MALSVSQLYTVVGPERAGLRGTVEERLLLLARENRQEGCGLLKKGFSC